MQFNETIAQREMYSCIYLQLKRRTQINNLVSHPKKKKSKISPKEVEKGNNKYYKQMKWRIAKH